MKKNTQKIDFLTSCFENNLIILGILFILMFTIFSIINPRIFLNANNLQSIAFQFSELGLFALAMCLAIIPGGIDLSVVATANLSAVLMALFLKKMGGDAQSASLTLIAAALLLGLCVGAFCGLVNGVLVGILEIPAILASLVTMTLYNGFSIGITKGATVAGIPKNFLPIGIGTIGGVPVPLLIFIGVSALLYILVMKHRFGWSLFLIGTSVDAARLAGIKHKTVIMQAHIIIGVVSAIAGIVILGRTNSASAVYGTSYILTSILVVILGGVSILGGRGYFSGVILAVVFLQVLSTGFNMLLQGVSGGNFFKDLAWGVLLLLMIFINKQGSLSALFSKFVKK